MPAACSAMTRFDQFCVFAKYFASDALFECRHTLKPCRSGALDFAVRGRKLFRCRYCTVA
jgi:hypothetical protein